MKVQRLTKVVDVVHLWPFFVEGFTFVDNYLRYTLPISTYGRIVRCLVKNPKAWVGVSFDGNTPISFACAHETTPMFSQEREFEISMLFHRPGRSDAAMALKESFESWCKTEEVVRYFVTTRRDNPSALRCFQSNKYGLTRAYTVFKKELK